MKMKYIYLFCKSLSSIHNRFDLFTDYRHETGHRNIPPDPEPLIGKCLGIAGPRDPGSLDPVSDPETLPFAIEAQRSF